MTTASTVQQTLEEQTEDCGVRLVKQLEGNGITAADISKLESSGFHTVESIAYSPKKVLLQIKGLLAPQQVFSPPYTIRPRSRQILQDAHVSAIFK